MYKYFRKTLTLNTFQIVSIVGLTTVIITGLAIPVMWPEVVPTCKFIISNAVDTRLSRSTSNAMDPTEYNNTPCPYRSPRSDARYWAQWDAQFAARMHKQRHDSERKLLAREQWSLIQHPLIKPGRTYLDIALSHDCSYKSLLKRFFFLTKNYHN